MRASFLLFPLIFSVQRIDSFVTTQSFEFSPSRRKALDHRPTTLFYLDPNNLSFRTVEETTSSLLNGSSVGEWNRTCFQDAEVMMEAWSQWQSRKSALMVERLLRRVVEEQMAGNPYADNLDMTTLYNSLIRGWANSGENGGAERAEEILDYMQQMSECDYEDPLLCGPEISAWNAVMMAYARSARPDAPDQTIRVLKKLYDWNRDGKTDAAPNKETYACVLQAFAKKSSADAPELVRKLILHMEDLSQIYPSVKPDFNCHNAYITSLLESINRRHLSGPKAAKIAHEYLENMLSDPDDDVRPNTWSFNKVLSAWSRSGSYEMVERAESLIAQLEAYHEESGFSEKTRPNSHSYNVLIACYSRSTLSDKAQRAHDVLNKMESLADDGINPSVRPDTITYNSVMNSYAKSRSSNAPQKVEELLQEMQEIYDRGDRSVKPNGRSFNICLDAWAKSSVPGSAKRILAWIKKMKADAASGQSSILPNKYSYNAYLQALSKTGGPDMGDEAARVLKEMNELSRNGQPELKPDVLTMTNVIHCIALGGRDDGLERALAILNQMEDLHAKGVSDVRPNLYTYNCLINAAAKSNRPGKAQLALRMLRRMESVALKPQTVSYNNVLNACAFSRRDDDSRKVSGIALDVFREAREGPGANFITYHTVLRVISSYVHDDKDRWRLIQDVLQKCKEDGQVDRTVVQQVKFSVTSAQYAMLRSQLIDESGRLREEYTINAKRMKMVPSSRKVVA